MKSSKEILAADYARQLERKKQEHLPSLPILAPVLQVIPSERDQLVSDAINTVP